MTEREKQQTSGSFAGDGTGAPSGAVRELDDNRAEAAGTGYVGPGAPVLFLDFDGVLNHGGTAERYQFPDGAWFTGLDPANVARLNRVMGMVPEARIVVSSSWRTVLDVPQLRDALCSGGFRYPDRVIGRTPPWATNPGGYIVGAYDKRGHEIQAWIDEQTEKPRAIAIVDDAEDMAHLSGRLVRTDLWAGGLLDKHADDLIALLASVPAPSDPNAVQSEPSPEAGPNRGGKTS